MTELNIDIAIFASGAGSNAKKLIEHLAHHRLIRVALIVCNKPGAGVLSIAEHNHLPVLMIEKDRFFRGDGYIPDLKAHNIKFIALAGFLWKIPNKLIDVYRKRIINIHPALLPAYGGKGMYGKNVHAAVIEAREKQSGISIHYVDEHYDNGDLIFQARCDVLENDSPESLAKRIHALEHEHYARVVVEVVGKELGTRD